MKHQTIDELIVKIKALEMELEAQLHEEYEELRCEIAKKRSAIVTSYRKDREGILTYLVSTPLLHLLSVPIIWAVLLPALLLDAVVSLYQAVCFPIYHIAKVKRSEYIVIDRHQLPYLNGIEKLNCLYCSYFNGLMGYISEIAARTEHYWCPIRHAKRVKSIHSHYHRFFEYGKSQSYRQGLVALRQELQEKNVQS